MKKFLFAVAAAAISLSAVPASAKVYTLGSFTVPPTAVINLTPDNLTATGAFEDEFRFELLSPLTLTAGGLTTTAQKIGGTIVTNLDFGAVTLRDGFGNAGSILATFTNGGAQFGTETSDLGQVSLAAGEYTIVVKGNVTAVPARYDGNATFVAAPVPEPATWAMMLGGFGLLGGAVRRSRRQATVLA